MASTYLSKTFGSAGNQKTFTWSGWIRACGISSDSAFFQSGTQGSTEFWTFNIQANGGVYIQGKTGSSSDNTWLYTNAVKFFRDPTAWQHWVVAVDTTQATDTNRIKVYVNGTQFSDWLSPIYPSQNFNTAINNASVHTIGARTNGADSYFNGSMAHIHFIDGTAYDASAFGETDATTGIWKPKTAPSVTYGTNGFFLKFENSGSMGTDSSGNANNFTVNGTLTQTVDTPSNVFATLNALYPYTSTGAFTNGNTAPSDYNVSQGIVGTLGVSSGKWYFEVKASSTPTENMIGWGARDNGVINYAGSQAYDYCRYLGYANYYNNGSATAISGASAYSGGDICGCALDLDGNKIYWYKNGVLENTGGTTITASSTAGNYFPLVRNGNGSNIQCNFGNGYFGTTAVSTAGLNGNGAIFEYDVPTGYYALNTKNINTYG